MCPRPQSALYTPGGRTELALLDGGKQGSVPWAGGRRATSPEPCAGPRAEVEPHEDQGHTETRTLRPRLPVVQDSPRKDQVLLSLLVPCPSRCCWTPCHRLPVASAATCALPTALWKHLTWSWPKPARAPDCCSEAIGEIRTPPPVLARGMFTQRWKMLGRKGGDRS